MLMRCGKRSFQMSFQRSKVFHQNRAPHSEPMPLSLRCLALLGLLFPALNKYLKLSGMAYQIADKEDKIILAHLHELTIQHESQLFHQLMVNNLISDHPNPGCAEHFYAARAR